MVTPNRFQNCDLATAGYNHGHFCHIRSCGKCSCTRTRTRSAISSYNGSTKSATSPHQTASVASQIRGPCAPSNACKLGRPIITRSQAQPAVRASDSHRIQPPPKGCVPCSGESLSPDYGLAPAASAPWALLLSLLQTSPFPLREFASFNRKKAKPAGLAQDRAPSPSDRSDSVLIPVHATSSAILPSVVSFLKIDGSRRRKLDGVKIWLTTFVRPHHVSRHSISLEQASISAS